MIQTLFGQLSDGKIQRMRYALFSLLLTVLLMVFLFGSIMAAGVAEHLIGDDLQNIQEQLLRHFSLPFMAAFAIVGSLYLFGHINLAAKRCRDIGLPGWPSILGILILMFAISYYATPEISSGVNTLIWLSLALIPSNAFNQT